MTDSPSATLPRAILYTWPTSVWSTVPQLCLVEKGYSEDEYIIKHVDITKGENFAPTYLKINYNGTIPTLVVPTYETTGEDVDTRYRSLRDTTSIVHFLDQARSAGSSNTTSDRPAPALAPATIEGKSTNDQVIQLVHLPEVDPNFLNMSARSPEELKHKASTQPGSILTARREHIRAYIAEAKSAAEKGGSFEKKLVPFLEDKAQANESLWSVYNGQAGEEKEKAFFAASSKVWNEELPKAFEKLEGLVAGPFTLGDQISLADLHLISWLTRLITVAGGKATTEGLDKLEAQVGSKKFGPKIRAFWSAWLERESFNKVLVPSCDAFLKSAGNK